MFSNNFSNDTLCSGDKTQRIVFSGFVTSFKWVASGDTINGIPIGTQTGNFEDYKVTNITSLPKTTTITITPTYTGNGKTCIGKDTSFSITVNPTIVLENIPEDDTLCSGEATTPIVFDTDVAFTCTVNGGVINGFPTDMQTGNFGEYTLVNQSPTPLTALVKITSNTNANCSIRDTFFLITVFPEPTLTNLQNDTLCDNATTKGIVFTGSANFYEWTATGNVSGIPTGLQTGNFGKYTVTNKTANSIKSTISVMPKYIIENRECVGDSQKFEVIVKPATVIESIKVNVVAQVLCDGDEFEIDVTARGEDLMYQWYQDGNLLQGERNKDFVVSSVSSIHSGTYYVEVTGFCGKEKSQTVKINAGGGDMLVEKWRDVILVDNSSLRYIGYQWYKNGRIIMGATEQFYQEIGGLNGCYSVELRLKSGGNRIRSCERCAYRVAKSGEISVYPNPTTNQLKITNYELKENSMIEIYDIVGKLQKVECRTQNGEIEIDFSHLANGMYFLKVDNKSIKIIKN
jgi:hypothetical protein